MAQSSAARRQDEEEVKGGVPATQAGGSLVVMDFGEDAGVGLENLSMDELLTPFLRIVQKGSPQVDPALPDAYIEEARPGMLINTATNELYDGREGVEVMVCARDHHYGAWVPRESGGGFRGMLKPTDPDVRRLLAQHGKFKKLPYAIEGEAVDLVETIQFFVLYAAGSLDEYSAQRAIISMTSTAMPVAQHHMTRHNAWTFKQPDRKDPETGQTIPGKLSPAALWSYKWRFHLIPQQNASGSWFNWKIDLQPPGAKPFEALIKPNEPVYELAKEFNKMYRENLVRADYENSGGPGGGVGGGTGDIPF